MRFLRRHFFLRIQCGPDRLGGDEVLITNAEGLAVLYGEWGGPTNGSRDD